MAHVTLRSSKFSPTGSWGTSRLRALKPSASVAFEIQRLPANRSATHWPRSSGKRWALRCPVRLPRQVRRSAPCPRAGAAVFAVSGSGPRCGAAQAGPFLLPRRGPALDPPLARQAARRPRGPLAGWRQAPRQPPGRLWRAQSRCEAHGLAETPELLGAASEPLEHWGAAPLPAIGRRCARASRAPRRPRCGGATRALEEPGCPAARAPRA
mmetsp:Transcript_8186/g.23140  ORF Transcript_8186/g.23140 Transcript_8186/m.23140 type:complete len:211 (-) Transcript_8186:121-753(-)